MSDAAYPPISCIYHDLSPMTDSDSRAVEGSIFQLDGVDVRLTKVDGTWYFEDV